MKNITKHLLLAGFSFFALASCSDKGTETKQPPKVAEQQVSKPVVKAPDFNADSAYSYIDQQVAFGPRVPNTKEHEACGDYLIATLKRLGAEVTVQEFEATAFDGTKLQLRNIVGSFRPDLKKRVLLAAHWDTRPFSDQEKDPEADLKKPIDGANDGASGVGILMEVGRSIQSDLKNLNVGVDLMFFDGEDYGEPEFYEGVSQVRDSYCLGSQYWANNRHVAGYHAYYGILLDMAGGKGAHFYQEGVSLQFAPTIVKKVWDQGHALGYGEFFVRQPTYPITDDHVYVNRSGIPMIDIIDHDPASDSFFGHYWHTHKDNMEVIDKKTLKAVGQTLLGVLYSE